MYRFLVSLVLIGLSLNAKPSSLTIEITQGAEGALPIAVVPFAWRGSDGSPPHKVSEVVAADLRRSGRFKPLPTDQMLTQPSRGNEVDFRDWRALNVDNLVIGDISPNGPDGYLVRFYLYDVFRGEQLTGYSIPTTARDLRATAHHIADIIYEKLTGQPGAFATRIAYVTSTRSAQGQPEQVSLRIADADGYGPQTIMSSKEPIMSPAWSPDGRKIAYVSFENARPSIWVQEVFTGKRERLTSYKGINGAPAWSPDGRYLAMTLSKDGNPDVFVMDIARRSLRPLTRHRAIDTEPAWSPDGRSLVFTSDRGGAPQIYRVPINGGKPVRVTFEGGYNARASYSPDGRLMGMVTRVDRAYRIATLDPDTRDLRVLSTGRLDESPSFAPNGSMLIYATRVGGKGVLAAVSTDGRVQQRLRLQEGDVREPVWSPYLQNKRNR